MAWFWLRSVLEVRVVLCCTLLARAFAEGSKVESIGSLNLRISISFALR